jgi:DHA1 family bicyclomycin/chloramphenicol resistance-like MFS transporter
MIRMPAFALAGSGVGSMAMVQIKAGNILLARTHLYRRAIVLGLLIAVGAFAIDMYIPGFAAIARDLHTSPGTVQLSMTSFFIALALGQVVYGPVSDAVGRKPPIYAGLVIFVLASAGAAFAPSIGLLILARFFQGIGAAATTVVPMAVIRDEYTGPDAARLLSLAMLSLSVSPILAPVFGGLLVQFTSWRLIFVVLILISLLVAIMTVRLLPETHPVENRISARPLRIVLTYGRLLRTRQFIAPAMIAACAQAVLFAFISGSPFVFVTLHRVPPTLYGILFALHAIALIGISQFNAPMMRYFGTRRLIGGATFAISLASVTLAVLVAAGMTALWPLVVFTLIIFTGLGLIMAPAFLTAMEPFGAIAGAAAAIGAGLEFTFSSVTTLLMSITADGTARPMVVFLALAACGSFASWILFARTPGPARRGEGDRIMPRSAEPS